MRVFLALDLDEALRTAVIDWRARLAAGLGPAQARAIGWTPAERLHLTLIFFGEITAAQASALGEALDQGPLAAAVPVTLGQGGAFPQPRRPRVIWVDFDRGSRALVDLHAACVSRLHTVRPVDRDARFSPHITVGRVRRESGSGLGRSLRELFAREKPRHVSSVVEAVTLYESRLTSGGPTYLPLRRVTLPAGG